jgi:hypothetical protein
MASMVSGRPCLAASWAGVHSGAGGGRASSCEMRFAGWNGKMAGAASRMSSDVTTRLKPYLGGKDD